MRRLACIQSFAIVIVLVLLVSSPSFATLRDGYLGDVAVVAWLEGDTVKVALANESNSRKSVTLASEGWDQRWRPFFLDRTIVVPARTVLVESFNLSSTWRWEPLALRRALGIGPLWLKCRPKRSFRLTPMLFAPGQK